ncbi:unnamed protein product [Camellia sinensis]
MHQWQIKVGTQVQEGDTVQACMELMLLSPNLENIAEDSCVGQTQLYMPGCGSPCGVRVEVPWKPQKSDESKAFAHSNNSSCPCEPKPMASTKQELRVKEDKTDTT